MDNKFMKMVNFLFLEIQGRKRGGGRPRCGERLYAMKKKNSGNSDLTTRERSFASLNLHKGNAGGRIIYYWPEWLKLRLTMPTKTGKNVGQWVLSSTAGESTR